MSLASREGVVRFLKFAVVGTSGLVVNVIIFETARATIFSMLEIDARIIASNAVGIVVSIFTNFMLNDRWTWGDREKTSFGRRLIRYYAAASISAAIQIGVTWGSFVLLWQYLPTVVLEHDVGPTLGLLTGIACGMFVNFLASHFWAFEDS